MECRLSTEGLLRMADLALDSRSDEDVPPLDPVHLPEFGQSVSWLMCRNPMCASAFW